MKILVLGGGGREHALVWKLRQSPRVEKIWCAPGNGGIAADAECVAVDTGPDVVNRKAARSCGRSATERNAIVIDRFFDAKQHALAWAKANPHFMIVQVRTPDTETTY